MLSIQLSSTKCGLLAIYTFLIATQLDTTGSQLSWIGFCFTLVCSGLFAIGCLLIPIGKEEQDD